MTTYRQFDNPQELSADVIYDRLRVSDAAVKVLVEPGGLVDIFSSLDEGVIKGVLTSTEGGPAESRRDVVIGIISDNDLAGRLITTLENTADTDALMQIFAYSLCIIDENGFILAEPDIKLLPRR